MAGIYIHIPFCRKVCGYCDFYRTTSLELKDNYPEILKIEADIRKDYLGGEAIETIYFGGGTPSLIGVPALTGILRALGSANKVNSNAEVTIEVNPDDINRQYLSVSLDLIVLALAFSRGLIKHSGCLVEDTMLHRQLTRLRWLMRRDLKTFLLI
jgi:coproporphyrinogen III oxidase-like Fe-S oxidoreductase